MMVGKIFFVFLTGSSGLLDLKSEERSMKLLNTVAIVLLMTGSAWCQKTEALGIGPHNLELHNLHLGDSTYIIYRKKTAADPAQLITLVKINVESTAVNGRRVLAITQQWESGDEVVHTAKTLHDANDFSTVFHETWWKRLGYTMSFDFAAKRVDFKGPIEDAKKSQITDELINRLKATISVGIPI